MSAAEAVVLPVDKPAYDAASAVVMDTLRAVPGAVVEVLGWDEAFVGVESEDPEAVARRIRADVLAATDLHCSVGIGDVWATGAPGAAVPPGCGKNAALFAAIGEVASATDHFVSP